MDLIARCPCGQKDGWVAIEDPLEASEDDFLANRRYYCGDCDGKYYVTDLRLELKP
jgi:hypothetical protein